MNRTYDARPLSGILGTALPALLASSAALALLAGPAAAQARGPESGVTFLDTIAVVGTRTETSVQDNPASVTVLGKEEMEKKAPESIAEMLRDVPGVEVVDSSAPGMKRISIRGESSRRVTVLVDGQEITDHSDYGTPLLIDPSNVERIEVVRGPASVLHGAKAIGGVVNIITKKGADKPVEAELGGAYYSGSAGWQGWGAVSGTVDNFDYRFSGSLDDHGDRYINRYVPANNPVETGRLAGTAFGNDNLSAHLGYTFGEAGNHYIAVKAMQHRLWSESWTDRDTLKPTVKDFRIDLPKRDLRKVGLHYEGSDISDIVRKVRLDTYYQEVDRLFTNEATMMGAIPDIRTVSADLNTNLGATAQVDLQFHPDHYTIVGLHYLDDGLDSSKATTATPPGIPGVPVTDEASIRTVSAFAQNEWSLTDDLMLTAGARYYNTRTDLAYTSETARRGYEGRSDGRVVTSLGLTYTGIEDTTLRALYSEGYITPTLFQMFSDSKASSRLIYGNPALRPETSRNVEIGARYDSGGLVVDATGFYSQARDYIDKARCSPVGVAACPTHGSATEEYIYANVDRATTYGLELAAEYTLPGTRFTPYANAAWMRRELTFPTFSTYHSDTPALSGRFGLRWEGEVAGGSVWTDLFVRAASEVKDVAELDIGLTHRRLPGYGTLNFAFGGSFGDDDKYRFGVSFNNILNKPYRTSFDEIPGMGRSVEATLRVKF